MYTAAALAAANPLLLKGEVVYESDTRKNKIGDGAAAWNELPYQVGDLPEMVPAAGADSVANFLETSAPMNDVLQKVIAATAVGRVRMALYEGIQCLVWYTDENRTLVGAIGFVSESRSIIYGTIYADIFGDNIFDITDEEVVYGVLGMCDYFNPGSIPAAHIATGSSYRFVSDTEKSLWNDKAAKDLSNVTLTKSFSANGYYKAPDGLLLQWGYITGGDSTGNITVYFPTAFYTVPYCVITNMAFGSNTGVASASVNSKTASYFIARKSYAQSAGAYPAGEPMYWLAIGRWK